MILNRRLGYLSFLAVLIALGVSQRVGFAAEDITVIGTIQSFAAKGVTFVTSTDPKDDSLIDVTITVKRNPSPRTTPGPQIDTVGYALYDRAIDDAFCRRMDHSGIPLLEQKQSRENTLRISFRAAAAKNGYIVAKYVVHGAAKAGAEFDYIKLENVVSPP